MGFSGILGIGLSLGLVAAIALVVSLSRIRRLLKRLIYAALALRVIGAGLRYLVLFRFYGGGGDAVQYYRRGLAYADRFWQLDFSPFYDSALWLRGTWTGTSFVSFPSGIVLTAIGPSMLGEFVIFSMLAFLGLVGFAVAFQRSAPGVPLERYARWIWLFPSLWFWPSSVGKDALVLMGIGLSVAGFVGKRQRVNWLLLSLGTLLVFVIRPQVAAVLIVSFILAHWLAFDSGWSPRKAFQGILILAAGLAGIWLSMTYLGVGGFDIEGVQSYMETQSQNAATRGTTVEGVDVGITGIPMALVNILARPFIWEASNITTLISALEILALWGMVWYRRRNVLHALRNWRSHPMLRMAIPFILIYSISLGMLVINLGIIARQRIFIFPFLFLLLEALPTRSPRRRAHSKGRRPVHRWRDHGPTESVVP